MTALNIRGCRLVWSRLVDLGSIDPGSNPGSPTIPSKKGYCFLSFSLFRVSLAFLMLIQVNRDSKTQWSLGVLADKSVDKSSMAGNRCDNSYSPHSGFSEERVLKLIDESEIELAQYEIARKVHTKRSTVRVILRKLVDRDLILQPYPGVYCNIIIYGMQVEQPIVDLELLTFECNKDYYSVRIDGI